MRLRSIIAASLVVSIAVTTPQAASAENEADTIEELRAAAPEIAEMIAPSAVSSTSVGDVDATVEDDTISISSDSGRISLTAEETGASSEVKAVLLDDASALFAIRIDDATAPRTYDFALDLPSDATAELLEGGAMAYLSSKGEYLGGVAEPWAKDAIGQEIPTWFTYADGVLTQHVDIDAVEDVVYPLVADPYLGKWLVESAYVTNQGGSKYVVRAVPTAFGRQNNALGTYKFHTADLKARLGTNANKVTSTILNQFHCHVAANGSGGGATYDMESWRPDVFWWVQVAQGCNP